MKDGSSEASEASRSDSPETANFLIIEKTTPGIALGTPVYRSPEQVGERTDHPADIVAFACLPYEMLSGRRPCKTPVESMKATLNDGPADLSDGNNKILPALERFMIRCLENHSEWRFQSAE